METLVVFLMSVSCAHEAQFFRPGGTPGTEVSLSRSLLPGAGKSKEKESEILVTGGRLTKIKNS